MMYRHLILGLPANLLAIGLWLALSNGVHAGPSLAERGKDHWAFQPVRVPAVPSVHDCGWVRLPVDAFVLARLEAAGLRPAPPADKRTLLRRVTFDLIGLPPTPAEQRAFLADDSPEAFAKVVDRLLARPEYGERWGRHWLDVVRYAESNGYERDGTKPSAWRYRDYVLDAFNNDKPYDHFVREQIAGDELPGWNAQMQIATTFLRLGTWDDEPANPTVDRYDQLDDVLGVTATAFLGLTLRCARCHHHKFEPFSQADYYRMLAVFQPLRRPRIGRKELDHPVGNDDERVGWKERSQEPPRAYVWFEEGPKAPATHILKRGNPNMEAEEVGPGLPAVLVHTRPPPPVPLPTSTGRRLWLARWLADENNPLTARVMVNRVWMHHFGKGLVATPNDFGLMGEPPSHPELLDWLAARFVADGWRLKPIHRLLVLSSTYQTSAAARPPMRMPLGDWRCSGAGGSAGWRRRRCATRCCRSAANSTPRCTGRASIRLCCGPCSKASRVLVTAGASPTPASRPAAASTSSPSAHWPCRNWNCSMRRIPLLPASSVCLQRRRRRR